MVKTSLILMECDRLPLISLLDLKLIIHTSKYEMLNARAHKSKEDRRQQ